MGFLTIIIPSIAAYQPLLISIFFFHFSLTWYCWNIQITTTFHSVAASASGSTTGVVGQRSGGGATIGFNGRKFGVSRPPKFQPLGGKGKKANKGIKSSKWSRSSNITELCCQSNKILYYWALLSKQQEIVCLTQKMTVFSLVYNFFF